MSSLEVLVTNLKESTKNITSCNLELQEVNRRIKQVQDIYNSYISLKNEYERSLINTVKNNIKSNNENNNKETSNDVFDETKNYEGLTYDQILKQQKDTLNNQDEKLDSLYNLLKQNRNYNNLMNTEVKNQNEHLSECENLMDKVHNKVDKTNLQLDFYGSKSSNNCLVFIIVIELLILILVSIAI